MVKDVVQSYIHSNIIVREEPGSDLYQQILEDKDSMRWKVLVPTKVHMVRWDVDRSYGAICDRFGQIDKTDKRNFDLNGSENGLPFVNALSLSWPRYTRFDDPWKETAHVERCLGRNIQEWFVKTFPPGDVKKCKALSEKITGVKVMEVPMEVCNSSFVKTGYT